MSVRDAVAGVLRNFASIPAERIWGRAKNLPVHDSECYLSDTEHVVDKGVKRFDPYSLGPEGNVWAGSPEDVAEALDKAGLLAPEGRFIGYTVMSETEIEGSSVVSSAGGVRTDRSIAENHLGYCRASYGEIHKDLSTRFFIAEVREVHDDAVE